MSEEPGLVESPRSFPTRGEFDPNRSESVISGKRTPFTIFAWIVLIYNLLAVAWGVTVRASKSGDGCGNHWPLCDGSSIPLNGSIAKLIEASHRLSTALVGVFAIALVVWAFRKFSSGHLVRKASAMVLALTLLEGLIGAALVKFQLVTNNESSFRLVVMSFHVISTFFLLGSIAVAALASMGFDRIRVRGQGAVAWMVTVGALCMMLLGISGAISALAHTVKPTDDVIGAALQSGTHWLVRLQPFHPLISVTVGLYLCLAAGLMQHLRPDPKVKFAAQLMIGMYVAQLALGVLNIYANAPIAVQMLHLVVADLNWVSLIVLAVFTLSDGIEQVESRPAPDEADKPDKLQGRDLINAYIALTKPRVISLLLFTTLTAMVAAKGGWPGTWLFIAVGVGGYMAAGAANAINMVIDRDIDLAMKRTAKRPTVTQSIPSTHALTFAFSLAIISFGLLWSVANLLSAVMALSGLVFYVVIYTMFLKRRTWHNIVIGGAAGAFPPLVGWSAVTGDLPLMAFYLFAIIFVWTPVHFWALALLIKDDYAAAGVPMLPVVKGDRNTVMQIGAYAILTVVITMMPYFVSRIGWIYVIAASCLNVLLLFYCGQLIKTIDRPRASRLFHYSMIYLALLFLALAVDRSVVGAMVAS